MRKCESPGTLPLDTSFICAIRDTHLTFFREDRMRSHWSVLLLLALAAACGERTISGPVVTPTASLDRAAKPNDDVVGGVFTETDDATSNAVVAFARHADGTLSYVANYPTDGQGLGG